MMCEEHQPLTNSPHIIIKN